jgi:hypothetical protein
VDNFLTVFFFNEFKAQVAKSWKSYVFIDFCRAFALIECPASARVKSALQALIRAISTQRPERLHRRAVARFKQWIFGSDAGCVKLAAQ